MALKISLVSPAYPKCQLAKINFNNIVISSCERFTATDALGIDLKNVKIIAKKDPVYVLDNVKNFNFKEGYFPVTAAVFIRGDRTTTGVNVRQLI